MLDAYLQAGSHPANPTFNHVWQSKRYARRRRWTVKLRAATLPSAIKSLSRLGPFRLVGIAFLRLLQSQMWLQKGRVAHSAKIDPKISQ